MFAYNSECVRKSGNTGELTQKHVCTDLLVQGKDSKASPRPPRKRKRRVRLYEVDLAISIYFLQKKLFYGLKIVHIALQQAWTLRGRLTLTRSDSGNGPVVSIYVRCMCVMQQISFAEHIFFLHSLGCLTSFILRVIWV